MVELLVVLVVMVLVLSVAIPSFSAMNAEARLVAATQTINSAMTRAYYLGVGDVNMTAVRFAPGAWLSDAEEGGEQAARRQQMVIYRYAGVTFDDSDGISQDEVDYDEYFVRREGAEAVELPTDVWVAPLEALQTGAQVVRHLRADGSWNELRATNFGEDFVLDGAVGQFNMDAGDRAGNDRLLNADDFTLVMDPKAGLRTAKPQPWRLRAYNPYIEQEVDLYGNVLFQRYSFSGVVVYEREPFVELGNAPADRQAYLQDRGRPYLAQRFGGGLTAGLTRPE